jgi:hypothetical protein
MDVFCEGKRQKRKAATIETYPEGFVPPQFKHWRTAKQAREPGVAKEHAGPGKEEGNQSPSVSDGGVGPLGSDERAEPESATLAKPAASGLPVDAPTAAGLDESGVAGLGG